MDNCVNKIRNTSITFFFSFNRDYFCCPNTFEVQARFWPLLLSKFKKEREREKENFPYGDLFVSLFACSLFQLERLEIGDQISKERLSHFPFTAEIYIFCQTFLHHWKPKRTILRLRGGSWIPAFSLFILHPLKSVDLAQPLSQPRSWMQPLRLRALPCNLIKGLPSFHSLPCKWHFQFK